MDKLKFRFEKDEWNKHYSYLIPLNKPTENMVKQNFLEPWFDGSPSDPMIVLYNGRVINKI